MDRTARVADFLQRELGTEVRRIEGSMGELSVLVGDATVARRRWFRFPSDETVLAKVREALAGAS